MNNHLVRTPIVDATGKQTHVWRGDKDAPVASKRLSAVAAPVIVQPVTKAWEDLTYDEKRDYAAALTMDTLYDNNVDGWSFVTHKSHVSMGQANYSKKTISLSSVLIENASEDDIRRAVIHEVAHAVAGAKNDHNRIWKLTSIRLGGSGNTTEAFPNMPVAPGGKKAAILVTKDRDGVETSRELKVYVGDTIRAWDGVNVTITKINRKNFVGSGDNGKDYQIRYESVERYRDDYLAVQQNEDDSSAQ